MREQWLGEFKHVPTALIQSSFSFSLAAMKYMVSFCTHRPHRLAHKRASAENMTATAGGSERGREATAGASAPLSGHISLRGCPRNGATYLCRELECEFPVDGVLGALHRQALVNLNDPARLGQRIHHVRLEPEDFARLEHEPSPPPGLDVFPLLLQPAAAVGGVPEPNIRLLWVRAWARRSCCTYLVKTQREAA